MGFLSRSSGLSRHEAEEVMRLVQGIHWCGSHARPMPLVEFVEIFKSRSQVVEHQERHVRRLQAKLKAHGYLVVVTGKGDSLSVDFSKDEALARQVADLEGDAQAVLNKRHISVQQSSPGDPPDDTDLSGEELHALRTERFLGLTIRGLCSRYGIHHRRVRAILLALGCEPRRSGRPLVEERRAAAVIERALAQDKGFAHVKRVAEVLGCHRNTAREFLGRVREAKKEGPK